MRLIDFFKFSSPLYMYGAFFAVFIFGEFFFRLAREELQAGWPQWLEDFTLCNLMAMLFVLSFYVVSCGHKVNFEAESFSGFSSKFVRKIMLVTLGMVLVLVLIGISAVGNPFANPLKFRQAIQGGGAAYFFVMFFVLLKLSGIIYFNSLYSKSARWSLHLYAGFLVLFSLTTGFASLFAYFFIAGLLYLNVRYNVKVVRLPLVLGLLFLLVLTPLYTVMREGVMFGGGDLIDIFEQFQNRILDNFFVVIYNRFDYFDLQVNGAKVARDHADFMHIFNAFFQMIPRGIYPEKPPTYSTMMTAFYAPEVLALGVTINFGYINEFTLYFGDFGPLAAGLFFGAMLFISFCQVLKAKKSGHAATIYVIVLHAYLGAFMGGGFINDMPVATLLISLVLMAILRLRRGVFEFERERT